MERYTALADRAKKYTEILNQVIIFRNEWAKTLKKFIINESETILKHTGIVANIEVEEQFENLESITISLGKSISGIAENIMADVKRNIIKDQGSLIYSQLFNGKIQAWMISYHRGTHAA